MVYIIKKVRVHGFECWTAQAVDRATKAVMHEAMFLSANAARAWCLMRSGQ